MCACPTTSGPDEQMLLQTTYKGGTVMLNSHKCVLLEKNLINLKNWNEYMYSFRFFKLTLGCTLHSLVSLMLLPPQLWCLTKFKGSSVTPVYG